MIYLIEGVPGSGKTFYGMQKHLIPSFCRGMNIFTNIEGLKLLNICALYGANVEYVENVRFKEPSDIDGVRSFFNYSTPANSLIIVDELQNYYNSRDFKEPHARNVIDYLTQHRHYGHTIVGISQNIDSVDITFRRNAAQVYRLTNMGFIGLRSKAKVHYFESSDTTRSPIATSVISYDSKVFKCYDSVQADAEVIHTKFIFPKKLLFVIAVAVFFVYASHGLKNNRKVKDKPVKQTEQKYEAKAERLETDKKEEKRICFGSDCVRP
jgi:zona occludens toxin